VDCVERVESVAANQVEQSQRLATKSGDLNNLQGYVRLPSACKYVQDRPTADWKCGLSSSALRRCGCQPSECPIIIRADKKCSEVT
jgi:hypothetical protein